MNLEQYVEQQIIPRYAHFDKAHREEHVRMVIAQSLKLAEQIPDLNRDMVYAIAAFHDFGLVSSSAGTNFVRRAASEPR